VFIFRNNNIFQRRCTPLCDKDGFKRNRWRFWGNVHIVDFCRLSAKERICIRGGRRRRRSRIIGAWFDTWAR
jgi:hypothetical protein